MYPPSRGRKQRHLRGSPSHRGGSAATLLHQRPNKLGGKGEPETQKQSLSGMCSQSQSTSIRLQHIWYLQCGYIGTADMEEGPKFYILESNLTLTINSTGVLREVRGGGSLFLTIYRRKIPTCALKHHHICAYIY